MRRSAAGLRPSMPFRRDAVRAMRATAPSAARASLARRRWRSASLQIAAKVRRRDRALEITEGATVFHLARRVEQSAHGGAPQRGREADAAHAGCLELRDTE